MKKAAAAKEERRTFVADSADLEALSSNFERLKGVKILNPGYYFRSARESQSVQETASEPTTNSDAGHTGENPELNTPDVWLQTPSSQTNAGSGLASDAYNVQLGSPEETQTVASALGTGAELGAGRGGVEDVPDWQELYFRGALEDVRDLKVAFELSQQRIERVVQDGLGEVRHLDEARQRDAIALRDEIRSNRTEATREAQDNRLEYGATVKWLVAVCIAILLGVAGLFLR